MNTNEELSTPDAAALARELASLIYSALRYDESQNGYPEKILSILTPVLARLVAEREAWKKADNIHTRTLHEVGDILAGRKNNGYLDSDVVALATKLRAELAEARKDSERLDVLQFDENGNSLGYVCVFIAYPPQADGSPNGQYCAFSGTTRVREVIDKAIAARAAISAARAKEGKA